MGIQIGAGFAGFGGSLTYHLKPVMRSSFFSLTYWHQGIASFYVQSIVGGTFTFRAKKIFSAQLGLGYVVHKGIFYENVFIENQPAYILLFSIGAYKLVKHKS